MALMVDLQAAAAALQGFKGTKGLTSRIALLEGQLNGLTATHVGDLLSAEGVSGATLAGAVEIKRMAGEVNVAIHALGIMLSLPRILEPDEVVLETSLGAGNTGRQFDLTTDRRIAEFKFIHWRGGAEAIRQNGLFVDVFHLAEADTTKQRFMYLTEVERPVRFLEGRRSIASILSKNRAVEEHFRAVHGSRYAVARDYWLDVRSRVTLVDASKLVPELRGLPLIDETAQPDP